MTAAPRTVELRRERERRAPVAKSKPRRDHRERPTDTCVCCGGSLSLRRAELEHFKRCTRCPRVELQRHAPARRGPRFVTELAAAVAHAMPSRWPPSSTSWRLPWRSGSSRRCSMTEPHAHDGDPRANHEADLDRLYPARLALLLTRLCTPAHAHTHAQKVDDEWVEVPCAHLGKVPLDKGWNAAGVARCQSGEGREEHIATLARHLEDDGNVGLVVPPGRARARCRHAGSGARPRSGARRCAAAGHRARLALRRARSGGCGDQAAPSSFEVAPGVKVDLRSGGSAQIVCEPSVHATGALYCWKRELPADLAELPALPADWLARMTEPRRASGTNGSGSILKGQRNAELFRIAAGMRARGEDGHTIFGELCRVNAERCPEPLGTEEVERIAASACRYEAGEPVASVREGDDLAENLTDLGNAQRLVRLTVTIFVMSTCGQSGLRGTEHAGRSTRRAQRIGSQRRRYATRMPKPRPFRPKTPARRWPGGREGARRSRGSRRCCRSRAASWASRSRTKCSTPTRGSGTPRTGRSTCAPASCASTGARIS